MKVDRKNVTQYTIIIQTTSLSKMVGKFIFPENLLRLPDKHE